MKLSVSHAFLPKHSSVRASQVMDHFGIDFEHGRHVIAENLDLPIAPGQVVLFTGASGSGKSSLMCAAAAELSQESRVQSLEHEKSAIDMAVSSLSDPPVALDSRLLSLDSLQLPDTLLIDALNLPADESMNLLANCGLGEAHLMLRTPGELSDGQRYRFRLALALSQRPQWIIADEFTATLDRTLAKVIAFNIRRLAARTGVGFLLATTHEDVTADLDPDVHVRCRLDGAVRVETREVATETQQEGEMRSRVEEGSDVTLPQDASDSPLSSSPLLRFPSSPSHLTRKKKAPRGAPSPSPPNSGSPRRPVPTGRTSLGGITAVTTSASPAS